MCRAGALVSRPTALASCPHHSRFHHTRGISLHPILFPSSPWPVPIWRVALDHENRKTPISKPAANAQRPNVQAETRRTRLRRSCGISWDRSIIDSRVPFAAIAGAILYGRTPSRRPGHAFKLPPNSGPRLSDVRHWCCAVRWPGLHFRVAYFSRYPKIGTSAFDPKCPKLKNQRPNLDCVHFGTDGRVAAYLISECKPNG